MANVLELEKGLGGESGVGEVRKAEWEGGRDRGTEREKRKERGTEKNIHILIYIYTYKHILLGKFKVILNQMLCLLKIKITFRVKAY